MSRDSPRSIIGTMLTDRQTPELPEWLHDLYPFRTRTAILGSCRMSLIDEGPPDAPPLLLIHGSPTWSFLYRNLVRQAVPQRRVIAPDNIGFGLSEKPRDPAYHTLARHIDNLSALVDELGLSNITLVVHGWGGPIGLGFAVQNPKKISRMVLCSTWTLPPANAERIRLPLRVRISNMGRAGRYLDSLLNLSLTAAIVSRMSSTPSDWILEAYKYPFPTTVSRVAIGEFTSKFLKPSEPDQATMQAIYDGLRKISAPADILVGASDPLLTRLPAYLLRDALPDAHEPLFVPNASHLLPEDAPDALANMALRETSTRSEDNAPTSLFKILR